MPSFVKPETLFPLPRGPAVLYSPACLICCGARRNSKAGFLRREKAAFDSEQNKNGFFLYFSAGPEYDRH